MKKQKRIRVCRNNIESFHDIEETEANYFAAELLVPSYRLKEIIFKSRMQEWDLINFCSDYFDVPKAVIINRLKWLEI